MRFSFKFLALLLLVLLLPTGRVGLAAMDLRAPESGVYMCGVVDD